MSLPSARAGFKPKSIDSPSNSALKEIRKAIRQGGLADSCWVVESPRLMEEAIRSGLPIRQVYVAARRAEEYRSRFAGVPDEAWVALSDRALESLGDVETSQGLLALAEKRSWKEEEFFDGQSLIVVLDRIQDPGNAGTIVRAAEAFGATGVVFLAGSASPDSPKVLRASAGSLFRLPCLAKVSNDLFIREARRRGMTLYSGSPGAERTLPEIGWRWPAALVVGNEGAGVSNELEGASLPFRIPTRNVESLNAAVSASVALYAMSLAREEGRP